MRSYKTGVRVFATFAVFLFFAGCVSNKSSDSSDPYSGLSAQEFVAKVNEESIDLSARLYPAYWVRATYITPDTAIIAAEAGEELLAYESAVSKAAERYRGVKTDEKTMRAIELLLRGSSAPPPGNAAEQAELAQILTDMEGQYGSGKVCDDAGENCQTLADLEKIIAESRDYDALLEAWADWRTVSPNYRKDYQRFVELANAGAREIGYSDLAEVWKSPYDMSPEAFERESTRLWKQVEPFYRELQCHVKAQLNKQYGDDKVPLDQAIPAHLLGNMWAQTWENLYDMVEPHPGIAPLNVTEGLQRKGWDEKKMTEVSEDFFVSLGLPELPDSFYENSLLKKPRDRDVVCHASAWDMGNGSDPRIKQCIEISEEHLTTLHHELGHIYYYQMYKDLEPVFKGGAHDGFHEAIGDTIVLSMTPDYLQNLGLIPRVEKGEKAILNKQMKLALEKIAFLPFGKMIDEWRWRVFTGEISPDDYNKGWWKLREEFQGVRAPIARSELNFDAGAKFHIPGNTPYTRYFLSFIMQFQFHKALCDEAGFEGPLHECSIYGNKAAGKKLGDMLAMGQRYPWTQAMKALTGQEKMDASAIIDYFAPLNAYLKEQNKGRSCGL